MKRLLTYFGLAGDAPAQPSWWGIFEVLPPFLVSFIAAWLDGASGWGGFGLWVVYLTVAWLVWLSVIMRFAPWRDHPQP